VISRVALSMFWFGVQSFTGSEAVYQMLKAIWPSITKIPNKLPASSNITTAEMMCYFLFWILQLPLMFVSPQNIRHLFTVKGIVVPIAWLSILIWSYVKVPAKISLATYATLSVNIPDFTRYAKNERAQFVQLFIIPVAITLIGFIGIAVTSAGQILYGEIIWDPLRLIDRWDNRAAAFFASLSFVLATLGTNISANSLSAANDMTVLFPSYINIKRGQVICALIGGWVLCPWEILASAPGFLSFMSGYTVFLGPFAGIMVVDYWLVHRGKVDVPAMYDPYGRYRYWNGINWRAAMALLLSIPPAFPGLINNINPKIAVGNASFLFDIAWLFGFFSASVIYLGLSKIFPAQETFMEEPVLADNFTSTDQLPSHDEEKVDFS